MPVHYLQKVRKTHKKSCMKYQAQMKKKFETYLREMYFNLDCFKESSYTRYTL